MIEASCNTYLFCEDIQSNLQGHTYIISGGSDIPAVSESHSESPSKKHLYADVRHLLQLLFPSSFISRGKAETKPVFKRGAVEPSTFLSNILKFYL